MSFIFEKVPPIFIVVDSYVNSLFVLPIGNIADMSSPLSLCSKGIFLVNSSFVIGEGLDSSNYSLEVVTFIPFIGFGAGFLKFDKS